jgi:hypothetical protein
VGTHALRTIIKRPDLDLVGLKVYSDSKAGRDAGEIAGLPQTGVLATTSVDDILAIEADCVNYNALGTTEDMFGQPLEDMCLLLRRGYNVTTTAIDFLVYPPSAPAGVVDKLEAACQEGGTSFFDSGVDPGYTMDLWPITLSRLSSQVDKIRIVETLDMRKYTSTSAMKFMGFGADPSAPSALDAMHSDPANSVFYTCMLMVADALRFEIEDYRYEREIGVTSEPIDTAFGRIEKGTVAVVKIKIFGVAFGRDVLHFEWVWRVSDDVNPEWGTGEYWDLTVEGDPEMHCHFTATTEFGSKRITSLTVAMAALNAIPTVCDASPGVKTPLNLPCWGGGFVGPTTLR